MKLSKKERDTIAGTFLFTGTGAEELCDIFANVDGRLENYQKNDIVFSPDSFCNDLGIVLSGRLRVTKGGGELVVNELQQGDLFGAAALFNDEKEYVSTLTAKSNVRILFLNEAAVEQLIDCYPIVRHNYIRYLSERIRFLSRKIDSLISGSGEKKLADYLRAVSGPDGRIYPEYSMTELAARLNVGRATLYRELHKLEEMHYITRKGKTIIVNSPEALSGLK